MRKSRLFVAWMVLFCLCSTHALNGAEPDTNNEFMLTARHGPWLICAKSFSGEDLDTGEAAYPRAVRMAQELRQKHGMPVYIHSISQKKQEEETLRQEEFRKKYPGVPVRKIRIPEEYAVLIGDFKDMDTARRALAKLKRQTPSSSWMSWPSASREKPKDAGKNPKRSAQSPAGNPLARAFVVPNPVKGREGDVIQAGGRSENGQKKITR